MFVVKEWLKDWVDIDGNKSIFDISQDLVKVGLEEEEIHTSGVLGPVVLGKVLSIVKEPQKNGKVINYCRVDVGQYNDTVEDVENEMQIGSRGIICGAHNFVEGDLVVVSLPGATLPGGFEIAARKTYGHISNGMICSQRELELGDDHDGIIVLNNPEFADKFNIRGLKVGDDLKKLLGLDDEKLEINITPDRSYCFSMRGIAREYAHSVGVKFNDLVTEVNSDDILVIKQSDNAIDKDAKAILNDNNPIHNILGCSKFASLVLKNVDMSKPTPDWIKDRLNIQNIRSISLPVDITNYVMMHFGQPLHAYDLDTLNLPITVRRAFKGETIKTLDDKERLLDAEDLVISDGKDGERAIGIAGVMGGLETEVNSNTTNILLESAYFEPVTISRSARRHKLPSEASKRYERSIDPDLQIAAINLAADLIVKYAGAKKEEVQIVEIDSPKHHNPEINLNLNFPSKILGFEIEASKIIEILTSIGCDIRGNAEDENIVVTAPSWRTDLNIKEDLVEEVARLIGYDNIPSKLPKPTFNNGKTLKKTQHDLAIKKLIANTLCARGWVEVISYPFTSKGDFAIQNPLVHEKNYMRTTLLDTLIPIASLNIKRGNFNGQIFETGLVYRSKTNKKEVPSGQVDHIRNAGELKKLNGEISAALPDQNRCIAGVCFSSSYDESWFSKKPILNIENTWLFAKEAAQIVLQLSKLMPNAKISFEKLDIDNILFHPSRVAKIIVNQAQVGIFGELSFETIEENLLPKRSCAFEIDLDALAKFTQVKEFAYQKISPYPPAHEDYAFVVPKELTSNSLVENIKNTVISKNLQPDVKLFDVFESDKLGDGLKSLSLKVQFFTKEGTISTQELNEVRNLIIENVKKLGAKLRE